MREEYYETGCYSLNGEPYKTYHADEPPSLKKKKENPITALCLGLYTCWAGLERNLSTVCFLVLREVNSSNGAWPT